MSLILKWYLKYRYPKYQRAYRLAFDPDGYHRYPNELKAHLEGKSKAELFDSFKQTLQPYLAADKQSAGKEALSQLADVTLALPQILELSVQLINWKSLANAQKKNLIALVAYLVSPIDIIPEGAFGVAGLADDALFASIAFNAVISGTSVQFVEAFWKGDKAVFESLCKAGNSSREALPSLYSEVLRAFQNVFA